MPQALRLLAIIKRPHSRIDGSEYDLFFEIGALEDSTPILQLFCDRCCACATLGHQLGHDLHHLAQHIDVSPFSPILTIAIAAVVNVISIKYQVTGSHLNHIRNHECRKALIRIPETDLFASQRMLQRTRARVVLFGAAQHEIHF